MSTGRSSEMIREFVANNRKLFEKSNEKFIYAIGLALCFLAHAAYLIMFIVLKVKEMLYFNIFSVVFYLALVILIMTLRKGKDILICAAATEIIVHAAMATYLMGWAPDFGILLIVLIPILFLMMKGKLLVPYIYSALAMGTFIWLRVRNIHHAGQKYEFNDNSIINALYILNALIGVLALVYTLTVYMLNRVDMEYRLTAQSEEFKKAASIDPLTQLFNRRAMNEKIREIRRNSVTPRSRYVIGIGDIDNFKKINDTYGHDTGDKVLVYVANLFISMIPEGGYAARWGGEEFLFVLPESQIVDGLDFTDQMHKSLRAHTFEIDDCLFGVTMTFGVSEGIPTDKIDTVITHADKRLYKGKNNGKNHTEYTD
ncbi:GGDEF domain-containing protein [Ruminococcus sp.]|uniref:GGDEF domain-containing protein n=1 Tax=Ruminococcus sp. TaxID=41978 RepID=UPI002CFD602C|nr:GGDEF domain-containing protein [Ruminococcus sp.]HNZ99153.1 GGDEF domain-containing protein [Ruminococcus sp.]HOH87813.1 GGDEF domain-containing protein [Ruminococcus sp.]